MMKDLDEDELALYSAPGDGSCEHLITARMAAEIRRHRSARAASKERVREVVERVVREEFTGIHDDETIVNADWMEIQRTIATRAADQLATGAVVLSQPDRVRLGRIKKLLNDQSVCWDIESALLDRLLGATK